MKVEDKVVPRTEEAVDDELMPNRPGPLCSDVCIDTIYEDGSWDTMTNVNDCEALITLSGSATSHDGVHHGGLSLLVHLEPGNWRRCVGGGP